MKLEVGQFARTEKGEIFKINNYNEQKDNPLWMTINSKLYMKGTVIKASHNIIDLIEVGDYVNGDIVIGISDIKFKGILFKGIIFKDAKYIYYPKKTKSKYLNEFDKLLSDGKIDFFEEFKTPDYLIEQGMYKHFFIPLEDNIKTILTKEQFENNCYKIEN